MKLTPLQICQIIPITSCLIIVRTAMLRFDHGTGQGLFTRTGTYDRLPTAKPMKVHIDRMTVIDSDVGKVLAHVDA
jgi:hypothetical protein